MPSFPASNVRFTDWTEPVRAAMPMAVLPGLAIAGFGIGICWLVGAEVAWWPITWFSAGALIYGVDRWADSGPDSIGMPERASWRRVGSESSRWLWIGGVVLMAPPLLSGEWLLGLLIAGGVLIAVNYSVQLPGMPRRFRERPILKSLLPAPAVVGATLVLPAMRSGLAPGALLAWGLWAWSVLQLNVWLCDWRDRAADAEAALPSLAVLLGEGGNAWTTMLVICCWLSCLGVAISGCEHWIVAVAATLYFSVLARRVIKLGRWHRLDWWVDGGLLLPVVLLSVWQLT